MSEFLKTNAPDPDNWILSSCFHAFLSISVHLGPFRYQIKLRAKRVKLVQLMQKVVPRCFVRIFCNKCSRSTPLDSKLMFWCISFHLGAFETIWLLQKTRCKMGQPGAIKAEVRATKSRQKFSKLMLPIHILDPKLMFSCVSFHLGAFGAVSLPHKTQSKTGQTGAINAKVRAMMSC